MKTLSITLLALFSFVLASCSNDGPASPTSSTPLKATVQKDLTIYGFFYNPCCDEWVELSGTGQWVTNANGSHVVIPSMSGTGSNGNSYTTQGAVNQNVNYQENPDGSVTYQVVLNANMVNDNGCSFKVSVHYKITVAADGTVTVVYDHTDTTC